MRNVLVTAMVGLASLGLTTQAAADASPPLYPPGSAVLPPGETMVQMVAETVEITIVTPSEPLSEFVDPNRAEFEARFTMRNQGQATEQMDVRFPLTDDVSWGTIWDFAAFVNGERVQVRKSEEPFALGDSRVARWAEFSVTFEPGVDVLITVTYSTHISGWGWGGAYDVGDTVQDAFFGGMTPDTATVYYTLETGAGWYGLIEAGEIILKLPYTASRTNVLGLGAELAEYGQQWNGENVGRFSGPFFAKREARWEFSELEPTREDNLRLQFLWPDEWRRIESLQAEARRNPRDAAAALQLAGAYLAAGANIQSGYAYPYHCLLSQQEVERGLTYHPASQELLQGLEIVAEFCPDLGVILEQPTASSMPLQMTASPIPPTPRPTATPTGTATATVSATAEPPPTDRPMQPTAASAVQPTAASAVQPTATSAVPAGFANSALARLAAIMAGAGLVGALILALMRRR